MSMSIDSVNMDALAQQIQAEKFQTEYAVKLINMARDSEEAVGSIIQDTVEFSQEAMQKFMAERTGV